MPHPLRASTTILSTLPLFSFGSAFAADVEMSVNHNPIDQRYDECVDEDNSSAGELTCLQAAHVAWDKALNNSYQTLLQTLPKAQKAALQQSQRQWLVFRNTEWECLDKRYAAKDGTIYQVFHAAKRMELTKQRALQLQGYQSVLRH